MANTSPPLRVALYTRVSTDTQAHKDEGSLDTQEARLRAWLMSRPGESDVRHTFREEGASGKSLDRPALRQLMEVVTRGEIDLVLVTRLDRLSRSLLDFYELHRLFEKHQVQFASLNETFDTSTPVGRAMLKLVLVFAELEREQTADRTRVAMQARAERGLWNGGPPPLGYTSLKNGHLEIEPHEAELVRLIFDRYLESRSSPDVARWLNDRGHRQKRFVSRRKGETGGKPFTPASIRQVIQNRLYLGEIEHKGEIYPGQNEAIVPLEMFERAQAVMEGNAVNRRGPPLRSQHDYPLTGVAQCECGYALTSSAGTGQMGQIYFYYRCVGLHKNVGHACRVRQIRAETLESAVFGVVREAARDPLLLQDAIQEAEHIAGGQVAPLRTRVDSLRRELAQVEEEGQRLLRSILSNKIEGNTFARQMLGDIEARRDGLKGALSEAEGRLAEKEGQQLDAEMLADAIRSFDVAFDHLTGAEKRDFLQLMLHRVVVHPDQIEVELYDGKRAVTFMEITKKGRARGGAAPTVDDGAAESQKQHRPRLGEEFVADAEWLPLRPLA